MQPKKLKGVTYTPMQGTVYSDPYAAWKPLMFQRALQSQLSQNPQQPQQQEKKGGWFFGHDPSAWIRELGGSGGAAAGAAAGSVLGIPGMIGGGILGAFLGGSAGSAGEQQVREGKVDWGKVGREGLEEAPWGAIPGALKGYKMLKYGGTAAGKGVGVLRGMADPARRAALVRMTTPVKESYRALGLMDDAGRELGRRALRTNAQAAAGKFSSSGGATLSKNITGKVNDAAVRRLFNMHQSTVKNLSENGINGLEVGRELVQKAGTANYDKLLGSTATRGSGGWIGAQLDEAGKQLSKAVSGKTYSLESWVDEMFKQADEAAKAGGQKQAQRIVQHVDDIIKSNGWTISGDDALNIKKAIDQKFGKAVMSGNDVDATLSAVQKSFSNFLRGQIKTDSKASKLLEWQQKLIIGREMAQSGRNMIAAGTNSPAKSMSVPNFINNILRRPKIAGGMAKYGTGAKGTAVLNFMGGKPANFAQQLGTRQMMGGFNNSAQPQQPVDDPLGIGLTGEQIMAAAQEAGIDQNQIMPMLGGQMNPMQNQMGGFAQAQQDPMAMQMGGFGGQQQQGFNIPREAMIQAMMNDFQATGGKNMDKLIKFFEFANYDALNNTGGGANLSADQKKNMVKMANVQSVIDELNTIVESGMFPEGGQTPLASLGGFYDRNIGKHFDSDKKVYIDQLRSKGILVIRAMGEVGNLSEAEQAAAISTLPAPGDSLDTARQKLEDLRRLFGKVQQNILTYGQTSPGSDMAQQMGGFAQ